MRTIQRMCLAALLLTGGCVAEDALADELIQAIASYLVGLLAGLTAQGL